MYEQLDYQTGAELCEQMAAECDTAILAFSTGKDSTAIEGGFLCSDAVGL